MTTYNGWTNRETWLVNLHFEEMVRDYIENSNEEDKYVLAENLDSHIAELWDEELDNLSPFLKDYIDLSLINWVELVENHIEEE